MKKGVKFRIHPNKTQEDLINRTFGCCRLIYNRALAMRKDAYKNDVKCGYNQTSTMLTQLKQQEEYSFLKDIDSIALQQSLRDLDTAYKNFFKKLAKYPKFKSKHNLHQSYRTLNQGNNIRIIGNSIKLPKLGCVKVKQSMEIGKINSVTVERTPTGKYYVVLNVDFEPQQHINNGGEVALDMGIKSFYTDSNNNVVNNPKYLEKSMKRMVREQRRLSRKKIGSNNRNRQRIKVARVHEKVTNQRNDFLQKVSTKLISENQTIYVEDLKVKNMIRNHKLAQSISSVSWGMFFRMLEYKAKWYGSKIIKVPTFYPSSQICHVCGCKNETVKNLSIRTWECSDCYTVHDRDYNASMNILQEGKRLVLQ